MVKRLILHVNPTRFAHDDWAQFERDLDVEVVHLGDDYTREEFIADLHGKYSHCEAIARGYLTGRRIGRFDEELVSHFPPSLKYIAHQGAGYDQCDVEPLTERGIQLAHCPSIVDKSTADCNLFLILLAMRNFGAGTAALKLGVWAERGFAAGAEIGLNPAGKVLGIIGMGGIGRAVRDRARGFEFSKIIYYNRSRLSLELECDSEYCDSLQTLVEQADVISVNVPLNKSTHHLIGDDLIAKMKDGVIIVNTARGAVIDEKALVRNLQSGKVGAAGLDVFEDEPYPTDELLHMSNVVATPHMGTHAVQTCHAMETGVINNIKLALTSDRVINLVPEQKGHF